MDIAAKDAGSRGTRWVCPSDRHLALRAKLRTGWSVKTGSLESRWSSSNSYSGGANRCTQSFVLTEEEQQRIIQVIRRAEALDLSEQERIGKLVERLENMKRNVCVVTTTRMNERKRCSSRCYKSAHCVCSCALCGEKFGTVLGASPHLCKDCRKYVCEKCGIETTELNTTVPRGGANGSARERTTMQRIVGRSSSGQRQYLCRICAETREMWKKSGAWFIKGMPKYILPEKKERGWSRSAHRTSTWTIGGNNRSLEAAEPQDSSSDEEATRRLTLARGQSHSFSSLQRNQDGANKAVPGFAQTPSPNRKSSSSSSSGGQRLSPLNSRREQDDSDRLDKSTLSIPSQCSRLPPTPTSPRLRLSPKASTDSQVEQQRVSFEDEILEEKGKKSYDINDLNEAVRKLELDNRSKTYQIKFNDNRTNDAHEGGGMDGTRAGTNSSEKRDKRGSGKRSILSRTGESVKPTSQQQQSNRFNVAASTGERNETKRLWSSRSLVAIRPSSSVPPVQSGACTRVATNGHPWPRRPVLQAQRAAGRHGHDHETATNKDGAQNPAPGVQRDPKLLRNNRSRCTKRENVVRCVHVRAHAMSDTVRP